MVSLRIRPTGMVRVPVTAAGNTTIRPAIESGHRAIEELNAIARGLSEEVAATARQKHFAIYGVGARAAKEAGDPAEFAFFMESGRAGALLNEAFERPAREVISEHVVPGLDEVTGHAVTHLAKTDEADGAVVRHVAPLRLVVSLRLRRTGEQAADDRRPPPVLDSRKRAGCS